MSRPLLALLAALMSTACGTPADSGKSLSAARTLTLASVSGISSPDLPQFLAPSLEGALRRSLEVRGYVVQDADGGDAVVRASWFQESRPHPSGRPERVLGISLSVFGRDGSRIFSARTVRPAEAARWNADRVAAEVAHLLRALPESSGR